MIYFSDKTYVTIWEVENKGNYSLVKMSSSRKDKDSGEYKNSNWSFIRFVGDAHKKAGLLEKQTRIVLKGAGMSSEPYMKDGEKQYPKNPQIVVFNWEYPETVSRTDTMDNPPMVAGIEDEENPF
jgi:hypothetical protein